MGSIRASKSHHDMKKSNQALMVTSLPTLLEAGLAWGKVPRRHPGPIERQGNITEAAAGEPDVQAQSRKPTAKQ